MRFVKMVFAALFCIFLLCGCEDANKQHANEWRILAEVRALTSMSEKYGPTNSRIADSQTVKYSSLFSMQSSPITYVTLDSNGKEYHVMVSGSEEDADFRPADDYQRELIVADLTEVISELVSVKPHNIHVNYSNCFYSYDYERSYLLYDKYAGGETVEDKKAALEELFGGYDTTNLTIKIDYIGDIEVDIEKEVQTVKRELMGCGEFLVCGGVFPTEEDSEQCAKYRLNIMDSMTFEEDNLFVLYVPNAKKVSYCLVKDDCTKAEGTCEFNTGSVDDVVYWIPGKKAGEYEVSKHGKEYVVKGIKEKPIYIYKKKNVFSKNYVHDTKGIGKPSLKFRYITNNGTGCEFGETYVLYSGIEVDNEEKMQYDPFVTWIRGAPEFEFWFSYFW